MDPDGPCDCRMCRYSGRMLYPYEDDLNFAYVQWTWPEASVMADLQLADVLDGRLVRFIWLPKKHRLICVWEDPGKQERARRGKWGPGWETHTTPSSKARWVPEHRVWVRCSFSWSTKPYETDAPPSRPMCTCEHVVSRDTHLTGCPYASAA